MVPGPPTPNLCVSLFDAEGLHEAEGEPVAPQDYPVGAPLVKVSCQVENQVRMKKKCLLIEKFIQVKKETCVLVIVSSSASLF